MSDGQPAPPDVFERIHRFAVASQSGQLTEELVADLEQLLMESDEACRLYVQYMDTTVLLPRVLEGLCGEEEPDLYDVIRPLSPPVVSAVIAAAPPLPEPRDVPLPVAEPEEFGLPPVPGLAPLSVSLRSLVQVGLLTYLACAALVLLVCFAAQVVREGKQTETGKTPQTASATIPPFEELRTSGVGQITGLDGCQWVEGSSRAAFYDRVAIGQTFHLEAGLLEITYDTGFRAILQGPVRYEVTSANGGFLSAGRLTGTATTPRARGFTINTPAGRVTDLGTEFGAEVGANGTLETVVFSGEVRLATTEAEDQPDTGQTLRAGQAAQVIPQREEAADATQPPAPAKIELIETADPQRFARTMPPRAEQVLIGPDQANGSFEEPAVDPADCDVQASDPAAQVYATAPGAVPRFWNPTYSLRTKGTAVRGVTGEQYVMLRGIGTILSTRFDGKGDRPPAHLYEPHTVYVLTADLGGSRRGMRGCVMFEGGMHRLGKTVAVSEADALEPIPAVVLNTDSRPEFVGKPINVSFANAEGTRGSQLYVDNVVLRALPTSSDAQDR